MGTTLVILILVAFILVFIFCIKGEDDGETYKERERKIEKNRELLNKAVDNLCSRVLKTDIKVLYCEEREMYISICNKKYRIYFHYTAPASALCIFYKYKSNKINEQSLSDEEKCGLFLHLIEHRVSEWWKYHFGYINDWEYYNNKTEEDVIEYVFSGLIPLTDEKRKEVELEILNRNFK